MSHILELDTGGQCWFTFVHPATGVKSKKHQTLRAEFNGDSTHRNKLCLFLDTIEVVARTGKPVSADRFKLCIKQLKSNEGEDFVVGSMSGSYKKLEVLFSI